MTSQPDTRGRRGLLLALAGAGIVALACALTWFSAPVDSIVVSSVAVTGAQAAPGALPLLMVAAATLLARAMTRGIVRVVLGWVGVAVWLLLAGLLLAAAASPDAPLLTAAADATGVSRIAGPPATSPWRWLGGVGGLVGALGAVLLATAPPAPARADRYERPGAAPAAAVDPTDPVDAWDALSRGEDPSAGPTK